MSEARFTGNPKLMLQASGEAAAYHVENLSSAFFEGRAPGTKGSERSAQYIAEQFQIYGLEPAGNGGTYFQSVKGHAFKVVRQKNRWKPLNLKNQNITSENVLGCLEPGKKTTDVESIVVCAHYDHLGMVGGHFFPGANDNASGVAVLLEAARVLASRHHEPKTEIFFAAWTLEEEGLYGSSCFLAENSFKKIKAVINLDTLGNGDPQEFLIWADPQDNQLISVIKEEASKLRIQLYFQNPSEQMLHTSDHKVFAEQGIPAVTILSPDWLERNHTFQDNSNFMDVQKLETALRLVVNVIERMAY